MRKNVLYCIFAAGSTFLGGCGSSLQEIIVDASLSSAKESIEDAVGGAVDDLVGELVDFGSPAADDEQPNE